MSEKLSSIYRRLRLICERNFNELKINKNQKNQEMFKSFIKESVQNSEIVQKPNSLSLKILQYRKIDQK